MLFSISESQRYSWTVRISNLARRKVTRLSIESNRRIGDILEEAIEMFLVDYEARKECDESET